MDSVEEPRWHFDTDAFMALLYVFVNNLRFKDRYYYTDKPMNMMDTNKVGIYSRPKP